MPLEGENGPKPGYGTQEENRAWAERVESRSLEVFHMVGRLVGDHGRHREYVKAELTNQREYMKVEFAAVRAELEVLKVMIGRALPRPTSYPPPPLPPNAPRRRLESLVEITDEDTTAIREWKSQVADLVKRDQAERAVSDWWVRLFKGAAVVVAVLVGLVGLAGAFWAIARFVVQQAGH